MFWNVQKQSERVIVFPIHIRISWGPFLMNVDFLTNICVACCRTFGKKSFFNFTTIMLHFNIKNICNIFPAFFSLFFKTCWKHLQTCFFFSFSDPIFSFLYIFAKHFQNILVCALYVASINYEHSKFCIKIFDKLVLWWKFTYLIILIRHIFHHTWKTYFYASKFLPKPPNESIFHIRLSKILFILCNWRWKYSHPAFGTWSAFWFSLSVMKNFNFNLYFYTLHQYRHIKIT